MLTKPHSALRSTTCHTGRFGTELDKMYNPACRKFQNGRPVVKCSVSRFFRGASFWRKMQESIERVAMSSVRWAATHIRLGTLATLSLVALSSVRLDAFESKGIGGVVVATASGPVLGETEKSAQVFRGIRFAAPPVGPLRFRPPVPPTPWTEVRPALIGNAEVNQPVRKPFA